MTAVSERRPKASETLPDPRELKWGSLLETALSIEGSLSDTYCRFYNYSFLNQLLLHMQGVQEPVATYQRWKDMGRQVIKGSRAKAILRPIMRKTVNEAGEEEQRLGGFKYVNCIFTASETDGEDLPQPSPRVWDKTRALGSLAITEVPFTELDGNCQGYSFNRSFAINPVARYPFKTMHHELGHIELGHTTQDQQSEYRTHRGVKEFQAEGVAYLAMHELAVPDEQWDAGESRAYVQHWLRGEQPSDEQIRPMFGVVDRILRAGRPDPTPTEA